ncbi:manganese catalase family protein [Carnobacterium sp. AT7]|uniref:manganese catalase family protein n=1 Tax=Carnobacterium sp. AT7 TaxID=333990 RepID=UPI003FA44D52
MSVAMQYLFQGWNTRGNGKYKDLILDTGSEEIGHVEMIATMIAQLLDDAPVDPQENAFESDPAIAAVMGGMDLQHAIVTGLGPTAKDSNGVPCNGSYITASENLLADFHSNINAESQGHLQMAEHLSIKMSQKCWEKNLF